jgi:hypothetical protein
MRLRVIFLSLALCLFALLAWGAENYNTSGRWVSTGAVTIPDGGNSARATSLTLGHSSMTSQSIVTDGGTVTVDGYVQAKMGPIVTLASGALTLNTIHVATAAADYDIPDGACNAAADVGNWVTVIVRDVSEAISITSLDASNVIHAPGVALDAGDELDSSAAATGDGEHITLVCTTAENWNATSSGGVWADGGAT